MMLSKGVVAVVFAVFLPAIAAVNAAAATAALDEDDDVAVAIVSAIATATSAYEGYAFERLLKPKSSKASKKKIFSKSGKASNSKKSKSSKKKSPKKSKKKAPTETPIEAPTEAPTVCVASLANAELEPAGEPYCFDVFSSPDDDTAGGGDDVFDEATAELTVTFIADGSEETTDGFSFDGNQACTTDLTTQSSDNGPVELAFVLSGSATCGTVEASASLITAGTFTVTVTLNEEGGSLYTETSPVEVRASSADVHEAVVVKQVTDGSGKTTFEDLPPRAFSFSAVVLATGATGTTGAVLEADGQAVTIVLFGLPDPSDVDNNDFSSGLDGWSVKAVDGDDSLVGIVPHVENPGPATIQRALQQTNSDLEVKTAGKEGITSVARTLTSSAQTTKIRIRYRFVTEEYPEWFGSEFNDFFFLTIIVLPPKDDNGASADAFEKQLTSSMNDLGEDAFSATTGSTAWMFFEKDDVLEGSNVTVVMGVANVGDNLFDSELIVDYIEAIGGTFPPTVSPAPTLIKTTPPAESPSSSYYPSGVPSEQPTDSYEPTT